VRSSLALLAIGIALAVVGCKRGEAPPTSEAPAVVDHVAEAKKALAVANWAGAAPHLRAALQQDPDSLFLHHNLAVCATWLDQTDEAEREFEWVLAHAPSDSDEATTARKWLAGRKKLRTSTETASEPAADPWVGDSAIHGIAMWGEPGQAPAPLSRYQIFLIGLPNTPTKAYFREFRTDRGGNYEFKKVPAGSYRLSDTVGPDPKWRLKVTFEPGQDLLLDLTPENGVQRRDDFPGSN